MNAFTPSFSLTCLPLSLRPSREEVELIFRALDPADSVGLNAARLRHEIELQLWAGRAWEAERERIGREATSSGSVTVPVRPTKARRFSGARALTRGVWLKAGAVT